MGCFLGMEFVIKVTVFGHLTLAMRYSYQPHCQMLPISMKHSFLSGEEMSFKNWRARDIGPFFVCLMFSNDVFLNYLF
jgi:hypothetical protein